MILENKEEQEEQEETYGLLEIQYGSTFVLPLSKSIEILQILSQAEIVENIYNDNPKIVDMEKGASIRTITRKHYLAYKTTTLFLAQPDNGDD